LGTKLTNDSEHAHLGTMPPCDRALVL